MAKKQGKTEQPVKTTAQQLGSLIKSARDIMRKDKGLNGDLDRLPMLTWIMFLKFLDDLERVEEVEAKLAGKRYRTAIEPPYRWRDWAAKKDGITGDELIKFINNDEAVRPDGTKGAGLFAYLRALLGQNGDGRRDVIANVFRGIQNRMISGYLLRDVVNLIDSIHFNAAEEIHTLGHLYESMLREMRDTAGDSGEFYTPRPVVRFMVEVADPRLGEVVLDPACGTGGFLSESYGHLEKQCKTVQDMKVLQDKSIFGGEAKPLPYMLAQMNLLLHGLKSPQIAYGNSLAGKLTEIGKRDRVDVILTNPPFGGEEEAGIRTNFPADKQTSETAHLIRDVKFLLTLPGADNQAYGQRLRDALRDLFAVIHRREMMTAAGFQKALETAREQVMQAATTSVPDTKQARNMAKRFRENREAYFRFITTPGVEPTNNLAEQAIRFVVIDRRITQGTRSEKGRRWCERIWTVIATCAQQGREVFQFLFDSVQAYLSGTSPPSLLPSGP